MKPVRICQIMCQAICTSSVLLITASCIEPCEYPEDNQTEGMPLEEAKAHYTGFFGHLSGSLINMNIGSSGIVKMVSNDRDVTACEAGELTIENGSARLSVQDISGGERTLSFVQNGDGDYFLGAPDLSLDECGWLQFHEGNSCRVDFLLPMDETAQETSCEWGEVARDCTNDFEKMAE